MTLAATTVWEIRTDGDTNNGGGFNASRDAVNGVDYSQQAAAQLSLTDLACASNTTLTSATGGFTLSMVGNLVRVASGTNALAGWYEITAYTNTNTVTIDRTCATGGNMTSGVGKVGGALNNIGTLGLALSTADQSVAGMKAYIRGGTYSLTGTTVNVDGGPLDLDASQQDSKGFYLKGYATDAATRDAFTGTRPVIACNGNAPASVIELKGTIAAEHQVAFIDIDGGSTSTTYGILGNNALYDLAVECIVRDVDGTTAYQAVRCSRCFASSCAATGFSGSNYRSCVASSCEVGFYINQTATDCIACNCSGDGFFGYAYDAINCVSYNSGGDGFDLQRGSSATNCISLSDGGYAFNNADVYVTLLNCASDGAASGRTKSPAPLIDLNPITLTGDPFTNAASLDFSLNDTAGAGAACRSVGLSPYGQTGYLDIGAVQHAGVTPDYPSEDDVRDGTSYGSSTYTGNMTLPAIADVRDGTTYGTSGTEYTGEMLVYSTWTETEKSQIRYRLGIDGTEDTPTNPPELGELGSDWTATERSQIRYRLGVDGTEATPTNTPVLGTLDANLVSILSTSVPTPNVAGALPVDVFYVDGDPAAGSVAVDANVTEWNSVALSTTNPLPNAAPGAAGGVFIAGTNAPVTITGSGNALTLTSTGANGNGLAATGNGSGSGLYGVGGATGHGVYGYSNGGNGLLVASNLGDAFVVNSGNGIGLNIDGATQGMTVSGGSGADISANIEGTLDTVTTLTNMPDVPTVGEIRTELETNGGKLDVLYDDWLNGGRLDLLLDAVKAKTDNLPSATAGTAGGVFIVGANVGGVSITNSGGDALLLQSTGGNGQGLSLVGNGTGSGLKASSGGTSGTAAIYAAGMVGMSLNAVAGNGMEVIGTAGDIVADITGNVSGSVGSVTTVSDKTDYKLASDGLDSVATTAPTGPAANFREMLVQTWRRFFKKSTLTATQLKTYADDGNTVVTTQTVSDAGGTETQGDAS